jgi:hypothetical protein
VKVFQTGFTDGSRVRVPCRRLLRSVLPVIGSIRKLLRSREGRLDGDPRKIADGCAAPELPNHLVMAKLSQPVDSPLQRERSEREGPRSICKENKTGNLSEKTRRFYPFLTNSQFLTSVVRI